MKVEYALYVLETEYVDGNDEWWEAYELAVKVLKDVVRLKRKLKTTPADIDADKYKYWSEQEFEKARIENAHYPIRFFN